MSRLKDYAVAAAITIPTMVGTFNLVSAPLDAVQNVVENAFCETQECFEPRPTMSKLAFSMLAGIYTSGQIMSGRKAKRENRTSKLKR